MTLKQRAKDKAWIRVRFKANEDDYRAIKWPPPGPYWCSGSGDGYSIVVAFVRNLKQVKEYWPEADRVEITDKDILKIEFGSRFYRPKWWTEEMEKAA